MGGGGLVGGEKSKLRLNPAWAELGNIEIYDMLDIKYKAMQPPSNSDFLQGLDPSFLPKRLPT